MNDRTDNEIEAGGAKGLAVEGSVTDLAALVKEDGALQLVRRFSLVETAEAAPPQFMSLMAKSAPSLAPRQLIVTAALIGVVLVLSARGSKK